MALPPPDFEQGVRDRAYRLWQEAGEPAGLADEFWAAARSAALLELAAGPPPAGRQWPEISPRIVREENAKIMLERAEAVAKAQDDGMRAMESRMSSLLGMGVTLGTAAIAAAITAYGAARPPQMAQPGGAAPGLPVWDLPWTVPALVVLSVFWGLTILVAAIAMVGRQWALTGVSPATLYRAGFLTQNTNRLRLTLARTYQESIDENRRTVQRYSRMLRAVVVLLAGGPIAAGLVVLGFALAPWAVPAWRWVMPP